MRLHTNLEKRLAQVRSEVAALRESVRVLDEQIAYQEEVADDAATRALVSATPLADRERRVAEDDARRTRRQRDETAARIADLVAEQDDLLERVYDRGTGGGGRG